MAIDKKALAQTLYINNSMTQDEVAKAVGVSLRTVNQWCKKDRWNTLRTGLSITREQQIANLYEQVKAVNETVLARPEGKRAPTAEEADILRDLADVISKLEKDVGISEIVSCGMQFVDFVRAIDTEKAKEFVDLWDAFLKSKLR